MLLKVVKQILGVVMLVSIKIQNKLKRIKSRQGEGIIYQKIVRKLIDELRSTLHK